MIFFATNKLSDEAAAFLKPFIFYSFNYFCLRRGLGAFFGDELEFSKSMKSIKQIV